MSDQYDGPQMAQQILRLQAEVDRLSGKTGYCVSCEGYAREIDRLKVELDEEKLHFKHEQNLTYVITTDRDLWKSKAEKLAKYLSENINLLKSGGFEDWRIVADAENYLFEFKKEV